MCGSSVPARLRARQLAWVSAAFLVRSVHPRCTMRDGDTPSKTLGRDGEELGSSAVTTTPAPGCGAGPVPMAAAAKNGDNLAVGMQICYRSRVLWSSMSTTATGKKARP